MFRCLGLCLISEYTHLQRMLVGVVFLILIGTGSDFLGLYRECDVIVLIGMLNGHIVAAASRETCKESDAANNRIRFLHC